MIKRVLLTASLLLLSTACSQQPTWPTCSDFLESWNKKPNTLTFTGCKRIENAQADRLVATYEVIGAQAEIVESALKEDFDMPALRFLCCGWETTYVPTDAERAAGTELSTQGRYIDGNGFDFYIDMGSTETLVQERENWSDIDKFYVRIETALGDI